jgi:hypothetical protein
MQISGLDKTKTRLKYLETGRRLGRSWVVDCA